MRYLLGAFLALGFVGFQTGCGPKVYTKGEYDDPNRVELLDDRYNEADMQQMAKAVVNGLGGCKDVQNAKKTPLVIVERVENRTEEHIDMVSLTNKIRTAMMKSGQFKFINRKMRKTLEDEYAYNKSGAVAKAHMKKRGKQLGADYILSGEMSTNIQEVGDRKLIYYKLTTQLTNLETSVIDCVEEKEVRKIYNKQRIGL